MFNELELEHYFEQLNLGAAARRYISDTRKSQPFRAVQSSGKKNLCGAFPSRKMGRSLSFESGTAEYSIVVDLELDDDVVEIWDQPQPTTIRRSEVGKQRTTSYTPDLLVLRRTTAEVFQVKLESFIEQHKTEEPNDWVERDGRTSFVPADDAFSLIGLPHRVVTPVRNFAVRTLNVELLLQARAAPLQVDQALERAVSKALTERSCVLLSELLTLLKRVDATPLLQMILRGEVHARLNDDLLSNPTSAWLALDPRLFAAIEAPIEYAPPETSSSGVRLPSAASGRLALARIRRLEDSMPPATRTRLRKLIRTGRESGLTEFASLLPRYSNSGNRRPRLSLVQIDAINSAIASFYATPRRPSKSKAFRQYQVAAAELHPGYRPVSRPTFLEFLARIDPAKIGEGRGGKRSGNAAAGPSPVETRFPLPTRPFQHASIDHCLLPLHVVLFEKDGKRITAQPWATVMRCGATGVIYSAWLSIKNPSCVADAIVLRRCVRAHGRLPEKIHSDRGADFWSNYFASVLAFFGVTHVMSPPASSRTNSTIEEVFAHMAREWLQERPGNSAIAPAARVVSKSHRASETAELTLEEAWAEMLAFIDWFNNRPVRLPGASPAGLMKAGLAAFSCSGIPLEETREFVMSTAVDVRNYKVDPKDGIRIDDRRYWAPALAGRVPMRRPLSVRLEPEDPSIVYALVNGQWHTCYSARTATFRNLDPFSKMAEATRVMEGFNLKKQIREEAQRDFTRRVKAIEQKRKQLVEEQTGREPEQIRLPIGRTIFDEVRAVAVESPVELSEEVFQHVLGKRGH